MTKINKLEVFGGLGISLLLLIGIILYHEFNSYTMSEEEAEILVRNHEEKIYVNNINRIQSLSIGKPFTNDSLLTYSQNSPFYSIWVEAKYQTKDSCFYEIKGNTDKSQRLWRFYIKTENSKIVSITTGK